MAEMTDEEAEELAELFAKVPPKVSGNGKNGPLANRDGRTLIFENELDGSITIVPPKVIVNKKNYSVKHKGDTMTIKVDSLASKYITTQMLATKQSPSDIINYLVKKELMSPYCPNPDNLHKK